MPHRNQFYWMSLGLTSYAELVVGPEPATRPPVPLPNLKVVNNLDRNFRIALNADLFYKDILGIVSPLLLNKEFVSDVSAFFRRLPDVPFFFSCSPLATSSA